MRLTILLVSLVCGTVLAQTGKPAFVRRSAPAASSELTRLLRPHGISADALQTDAPAPQRWQEVRLGFDGSAITAGRTASAVQLRGRRSNAGAGVRLRSLELQTDHLVVAGVDANQALKFWTVVPDARVVRAEFPGPDGVLRGQTVYAADADMRVTIPEDQGIRQVRVFQPVWDGQKFTLKPVGVVGLP